MNLFATDCPVHKFTAMYVAQALKIIAPMRASSRQRDVPRGRAENSKCKGRTGVLIRASAQSTEAVLAKIRGCVVLYGELVPLYGSAGLYLDCLKLIRQLTTSTQRGQLLQLPAAGIRRIWRLSKGYYDASDQDRLVAAGQWSVEDDFTSQVGIGFCGYADQICNAKSAYIEESLLTMVVCGAGGTTRMRCLSCATVTACRTVQSKLSAGHLSPQGGLH